MNFDPQVMSGAGIVFVVGLGIVFIGLIVIIALISLQALIFRGSTDKKPAPAVEAPAPAPAPAPVVEAAQEDEEEIAAVIAAVVALCAESGNGLVVRSVRRVGVNAPAWSADGRMEQLNTRF